MRLHRLVLTNYRGIDHREIHFPDSGVVVVCGANEIGKTSMIEALDLLLESKDRSTKKEVKQVKPTHADVGAEVLAEISAGVYRFIYRKRFHKKCETELTIIAPKRQQLTGDEAHERVRAILGETVDTDLWHAQRVLQAGSTAAVDLSGCDALSRALDLAAGGVDTLSGNEPVLLERIDAECGKYFTGTGRPTGEWAAAIAALTKADDEVARCVAAVDEVDERVGRHAELTGRLAELSAQLLAATERAAAARKASQALAELREQIANAQLVAAAAKATSAVSAAAHNDRLRMQAELSKHTATLEKYDNDLVTAGEAELVAREAAEIAESAAEQATGAMTSAQERGDRARRIVNILMARDEEQQLAARMNRIRSAENDLAAVVGKLAQISLTRAVMADIESATTLTARLEAQLALAATTVEFRAAADIELMVGETSVQLAAGQTWTPESSAATTIELPGLLSVQIHPGVNASDIKEKLDAAQLLLDEVLAQGGARDVAHAREIDSQRQTLAHDLERTQSDLATLIARDDVAVLASTLAELRAKQETGSELIPPGLDLVAAKRDLAEAAEALAHSHRDVIAHQKVVAETKSLALEKASSVALLHRQSAVLRDELASLRERLVVAQTQATDAEIAVRAVADADALRLAQERASQLAEQCEVAQAELVDEELIAANAEADRLEHEHAGVERALNDTAVELAVMGTQGRQGSLDAAQIAHAHAAAEHHRISRRARSAQLLRTVMARHREDTRQSYVAPFRREIERLGRTVFGESFEIDVDSDLKICSRTLEGKTVPYDSLSGGAKEQLGILARLAGAALVAKDDSVPVVIDDALGFSDPDRLIKMGAVFDQVGDDGQVIVLTCTPTRYLGIEDAHIIELTAAS